MECGSCQATLGMGFTPNILCPQDDDKRQCLRCSDSQPGRSLEMWVYTCQGGI